MPSPSVKAKVIVAVPSVRVSKRSKAKVGSSSYCDSGRQLASPNVAKPRMRYRVDMTQCYGTSVKSSELAAHVTGL